MPCTLEPWEQRWEERRINRRSYGREIEDDRLLEEVACNACRTLAAEGKLSKASRLVQAWARKHRIKDAKAGRTWPRRKRK